MEIKEKLEGKEIDNLDATSASEEVVEKEEENVEQPEDNVASEPIPQLNSTPVPTMEEKEAAGMAGEEGKVENIEAEPVVNSDDNVDSVPENASPDLATTQSENVEPKVVDNSDVGGEPVSGAPVADAQPEMHEELGAIDAPVLKFSQEDMDNLAGKIRSETRDKTFRYIYQRYGVNSEEELDGLVGNAQRYDSLQEQFEGERKSWKEQSSARDQELADIKEQVALMQSGIDKERYEDAKLILKGKGLEVNLENIQTELGTHPEWKKVEQKSDEFVKVGDAVPTQTEPVSKISALGNEAVGNKGETEEEYAMRLLKA